MVVVIVIVTVAHGRVCPCCVCVCVCAACASLFWSHRLRHVTISTEIFFFLSLLSFTILELKEKGSKNRAGRVDRFTGLAFDLSQYTPPLMPAASPGARHGAPLRGGREEVMRSTGTGQREPMLYVVDAEGITSGGLYSLDGIMWGWGIMAFVVMYY